MEESDFNFSHLKMRQTVKIEQNFQAIKKHIVTIDKLLTVASKGGASDLLLKVGQIPMFRYNGDLYPLRDGPRVDAEVIEAMVATICTPEQLEWLDKLEDIDTSYRSPSAGRIRVNIFRQTGHLGIVCRLIPSEVPTIDEMGLSPTIKRIADMNRGIILVTGATGSGKSTTLAAMIDHINRNRTCHILTIEDPIEFQHMDKRSLINQRELGFDTKSYAYALKSALRQNPDVILLGEMRDAETMEVALQAAETGHLVLTTMHTNDAADSITRIIAAMGSSRESVVRAQLADNLRAVISQRLLRKKDKKGRVAAQEIMMNTATIRERILKGDPPTIVRDFIAQGQTYGMQTFDMHLYDLYTKEIIDYEEAYRYATNRYNFDLRCRGIGMQ